MLRSSGVVLICSVFVMAAARSASAPQPPSANKDTATDTKPTIITKTFRSEDGGIYGVASISGLANRNGRVSSMSGVKFYPSSGMQDGSFAITKSSDKLPNPISFSKEENGKYTSGSIKIGPSGSVSVSSVARSGFPDQSSSKFKIMDDAMFFNPLPAFHSRSMNPWFANNVNFMPFGYNNYRPSWTYPTFNPYFNLWR